MTAAVLLVAGPGFALPASADSNRSENVEGLSLVANADGFTVIDEDGGSIDAVSVQHDVGQTVSYVRTSSGKNALLLELNWLSRTEGDAVDRSESQGTEPTRIDDDGNLVATGGVTAGQTALPEEVKATPLVGVLSTESGVQIALGDIYESEAIVLRDGETLGETSRGTFVENDLEPDSEYLYSIEPISAKTVAAEQEAGDETAPLINPEAMTMTVAAHTMTDKQISARSLDAAAAAYSLPTQQLNQWVHSTYIPQAVVPVSWYQGMACDGAHAFKGDNRGDISPTPFSLPSHRTAIRVATNWQNPDPWQMYWEKSTGVTSKIVNGEVVATKQADPNGIQVLDTWVTDSVSHFDIRHDVGDPFCLVGSVKYRETVQFWKSGSVAVNGRHNNVPNHESYASFNTDTAGNQSFVKIWSFGEPDFACLVGWNSWCDKSYTASFTG